MIAFQIIPSKDQDLTTNAGSFTSPSLGARAESILKISRPASIRDTLGIALIAALVGLISIVISVKEHLVMLYRDSLGHLGMARVMSDHRAWTLAGLGPLWLPLPQLFMAPFAVKTSWWHSGLSGALPSTICFVLTIVGIYRLARHLMPLGWSLFATAMLCFCPNLLYLDTTPMSEPLSIMLEVWLALASVEFVIKADRRSPLGRQLLWLGCVIFATTLARYDGWVLGAAVWCFVVWILVAGRSIKLNARPMLAFTLLSLLGPALWFLYQQIFWGSWLNFLNGPYTVKKDVLRIFPPGTQQYYGWHDPLAALFLYGRTAQLTIAAREWGYLVTAAALAGSIFALRNRLQRTTLMLWFPLPFHVFLFASGSLAMVLPDMGPFRYFMTIRYGAELLPALAIFSALGLSALAVRLRQRSPRFEAVLLPAATAVLLASSILILHDVPILLQDGLFNFRSRSAIVEPILAHLNGLDRNTQVMVDLWTSETGMTIAQDASIPIHQTIGPYDGPIWNDAVKSPATHAAWIIAADHSPIAAAVDAHPDHLRLVTTACAPFTPCVRLFKSEIYGRN